ncbi:Intraflagellar transport protein [Actinidia chinensis var. chinensis]|uniref:Intraflagellar transport protein n=1 Tax=Actinidia chinensis var. chinensis TaxID=1590841 RepID=A0A2R6P4E7_ACTCC|nr:Intraflagellar transport protein [Actinidia chinensis var. chinensis]
MALIPAWVRSLWEVWDVRILVLLSLNLQIILYILGNRRKYISSVWISIIVWLAYLMADWVATVALGMLSHAQVYNHSNNAFGPIWAPLILLHLGGPYTITAYSLEDNELWMRHFLALVVQVSVAVRVILTSWRNFWFSYLSIPAFVAGIIKYAERTWVLKLVSNDKLGNIVPFDNVSNTIEEENYECALLMAQKLVKQFKCYMENYDTSAFGFPIGPGYMNSVWDIETHFWDAIEVEMGLMYDLLYTKAAKTFTTGGCILRFISFACTVSVLIGFFCFIFGGGQWHEHYSMIDIAITGVLLVGALALEIYAVAILLSSDWTMLWLIKLNKSKWVIQLGGKFPWFFPMLKRKRWSKMMGQFDLIGFCLKKDESRLSKLSSRILGLLGIEEKVKRHLHKTCVAVPSELYSTFLNYIYYLNNRRDINPAVKEGLFQEDLDFYSFAFYEQIVILHIVTEMCYHDTSQNSTNSENHVNQTKETCRIMSHYIMYLFLMSPTLLPVVVSDDLLRNLIVRLKSFLENVQDVSRACQMLKTISPAMEIGFTARMMAEGMQRKQEEERWGMLKSMWLRTLCYAAIKGQKNDHLQQLRQGGELLTLLWFFIPQCDTLSGVNITIIDRELNYSPD